MPRQYPSELHIGQKVLVQPSALMHCVEALVTKIDHATGMIHVNPIGYKIRWQTAPNCIRNLAGEYLTFKNNAFSFSTSPYAK